MPSVTTLSLALLAAVLGAVSSVSLAAAGKVLGVRATAAVSGLYGIVIGPVAALLLHGLPDASAQDWGWAAVAGGLSLLGNALFLAAARRAALAVVAPVVASAGGLAAGLAVLGGASVGAVTALGAATMTVGVVMVSRGTAASRGDGTAASGAALACASAVTLAASYLAIGRAEQGVGAGWAYACLMVFMVLVWTIPMSLRGRLPALQPAVRWVLLAEAAGVGVFVALGKATAADPVLASVIYGLYAVLAAAFSLAAWRERPSVLELTGAAATLVGSCVVVIGSPLGR